MRRSALGVVVLMCTVLILFKPKAAEAASLQVTPVNLTLGATTTNGMLAVSNLGEETVRVQVSLFVWNQTPAGEVDLVPTHDLVFFPSILTLPAHDSRNVRISAAPGGTFASTTVEKTYRVLIEELLPPIKASLPDMTLRVLTRLSVPIFVQPAAGRALPRVEQLSVRGHTATFVVTNAGTLHFTIGSVHVFVATSDGRKLFETTAGGWYVLAQGTRAYDITLPPAACSSGAGLTVEVETDQGTVTQHLDTTCRN